MTESVEQTPAPVVVLNGEPRSGKSTIAAAIQERSERPWMNLGVDTIMHATPRSLHPGIGLRPGGERPDLEPFVRLSMLALYESVAAHARRGLAVVVDIAHHDDYVTIGGLRAECLALLSGLTLLNVRVHCPQDVIVQRRRATGYATGGGDPAAALAIGQWDGLIAAHDHDLSIDTSVLTTGDCAGLILDAIDASAMRA